MIRWFFDSEGLNAFIVLIWVFLFLPGMANAFLYLKHPFVSKTSLAKELVAALLVLPGIFSTVVFAYPISVRSSAEYVTLGMAMFVLNSIVILGGRSLGEKEPGTGGWTIAWRFVYALAAFVWICNRPRFASRHRPWERKAERVVAG